MAPDEITRATEQVLADDRIHEMLALASRLRAVRGGELDDEAVAAVAEATGAPLEYVRLAVRGLPEAEQKTSPVQRLKNSFLAFDPDVRRYAMGGVVGGAMGLLSAWSMVTQDNSGFLGCLVFVGLVAAIWNAAISRHERTAALAGAVSGGVWTLTTALVLFVHTLVRPMLLATGMPAGALMGLHPAMLVVGLLGGALVGFTVHAMLGKNRSVLGLRDPSKERHEMLQQLLEITEKLKSDERFVTFLSADIVGSTKLKVLADPLSVEFTFTEYHRFVETIVNRNGGRIHSTAGDGVTAAFENPAQGFTAAKAIMAGLFEFNAFRNRTGQAIELRTGLHTGSVLAPGKDVTQVNFAHVIDVAAHMQKAADAGALVVSEETTKYLPGGPTSVGTETVTVEDLVGYVWRPSRVAVPVFASADTPRN
ncbi:MAG: adenylate/guanylate cyclase domain-containing protein [Fimbriimonadaceae bacterium]|nr:adenylate/guanylate cyclase domain-containing protein [Fimbriimonadaceae bacterium]